MIHLIFGDDRVSLMNKSQIFHYIATNHDKKWYDSYLSTRESSSLKKPHTLMQDISFIVEQRNIFAHRVIDLGEFVRDSPIPQDSLRFAKFKNGIKGEDYNPEQFLDLTFLIVSVTTFIANKVNDKP